MALIPQVKCGRCDRTYSGLRSRCPYCGAHRHKKGKRVSDGDNATWKLIIGILLIVVLIAAVVVILVTSPKENEGDEGGGKTPPNGSQDGVDDQPGKDPDGSPTGDDTVKITVTAADGSEPRSLTVNVGEAVELTAAVTPDTVTDAPVWASSDESIVKIEAADETGLKYNVSGVAAGTAAVTVTVGEVKTEITVNVSEPVDTPPSSVVASSIVVYQQFNKKSPAKDFSLSPGQKTVCTAVITPSNATGVPVWSSSDTEVYEIVPLDDTGIKATATCVGLGTCTITVTIDGVSYSFIARGQR